MDKNTRTIALRKLHYGLYVVGVSADDDMTAFTCAWVTQCSFRPPILTVAVRKGTRGRRLIERGMAFSVNFLDKQGQAMAEYFFEPPEMNGSKLGTVPFRVGETGMPLIVDSIAQVECQVVNIIDFGGDHDLVIGKVVQAHVESDSPALALSDTSWDYGG